MYFFRLVAVSAMLASSMTYASGEDQCKAYDLAAKGAMEARQKGKNLSDALSVIDKNISTATDADQLKAYSALRIAFVEAYKLPRYSTEKMKAEAISDFRNDFYSGCLSATAERKPM